LSTATLSRDVVFTLVARCASAGGGYATVGAGPVPGLIESPDSAPNGTLSRRGAWIFSARARWPRTRPDVCLQQYRRFAAEFEYRPVRGQPQRPSVSDLRGHVAALRRRALARPLLRPGTKRREQRAVGEFYAAAVRPRPSGLQRAGQRRASSVASQNFGLMGFTAQNQFAYDRLTLSPRVWRFRARFSSPTSSWQRHPHAGLAGPAHRRVVSQTLLVRGVDYVLDYTSGLLRFINVILPFDSNFNPQVVQVQYQYGGPGAKTTLTARTRRCALARATPTGSSRGISTTRRARRTSRCSVSPSRASLPGQLVVQPRALDGYVPVSQIQYGSQGDAYKRTLRQGGPFAFVADFTNTAAATTIPTATTPRPASTRSRPKPSSSWAARPGWS